MGLLRGARTYLTELADLAMLLLARELLRTRSPLQVHEAVRRLGSYLPRLRSVAEARAAMRALSAHGTCLTRSLAIASRMPRADIAIGVVHDPTEPLRAHAWVEIDGTPIEPAEPVGAVIARLWGTPARQPPS